jgi:hypothetical protein
MAFGPTGASLTVQFEAGSPRAIWLDRAVADDDGEQFAILPEQS